MYGRGSAEGSARRSARSRIELEPRRDGVRICLHAGLSRPETNLAIVRRTFRRRAGRLRRIKCRSGLPSISSVWELGITTRGEGALFVEEAKRQGRILDTEHQLRAAARREEVARADVEQLVGRLSHTAQVPQEGNSYLQPLYRVMCASYLIRARSRDRHGGVLTWHHRRVRRRKIKVAGDTPTLHAYLEALRWWSAALARGISVPLAPRCSFPAIGDRGCAFLFTDAAREDGSRLGGFTVVQGADDHEPQRFLSVHGGGMRHRDSALAAARCPVYAGRQMFRGSRAGRSGGSASGGADASLVLYRQHSDQSSCHICQN